MKELVSSELGCPIVLHPITPTISGPLFRLHLLNIFFSKPNGKNYISVNVLSKRYIPPVANVPLTFSFVVVVVVP